MNPRAWLGLGSSVALAALGCASSADRGSTPGGLDSGGLAGEGGAPESPGGDGDAGPYTGADVDSSGTVGTQRDDAGSSGLAIEAGEAVANDAAPPMPEGGDASSKLFVGYYQTWSDTWKATGAETVLARLPGYVRVVNLSFMQPNASYASGSLSLSGTGVGVPYDGPTLKAAVAALHGNHPDTRILVSVGGATFTNWSAFDAHAVAAFVADFGLDGVDIDYEPSQPNCSNAAGTVSCPSDAEYVGVIHAMRSSMPRPKWLSIAAWSVGAYGEGAWANAPPTGSAYLGIALAVLKDGAASAALDLVNVMSYDAGNAYSPAQALQAYQHYFRGPIAMGIEVPPEAWGGHTETIAEIDALANTVATSGGAGLMLWSLQKTGSAQQFATEICSGLGLSSCSAPLM
jgi:chitinase